MSGFLYFVEGEPRNTADIIADHGLEYALGAGCNLTPIAMGATPGGKPGCLLSDGSRHFKTASYRADQQEWQRYKGYWVGFWKDDYPLPVDLECKDMVPGYELELGDGNLWRIPLVRQFDNGQAGSQLPHKLKVNESGDWVVGDILDKYQAVWSLATDFFDLWHESLTEAIEGGNDSFNFDYEQPQRSAIQLLSANYAICDVEASLLGLLLSNDTAGAIMRTACDCDLALSWILAKKNEPAIGGSPIEGGQEDSTENTDLLALT